MCVGGGGGYENRLPKSSLLLFTAYHANVPVVIYENLRRPTD